MNKMLGNVYEVTLKFTCSLIKTKELQSGGKKFQKHKSYASFTVLKR